MGRRQQVLLAGTVAVVAAYVVGAQQPDVELRRAQCLSATGAISCEYLEDGHTPRRGNGMKADVAVPRDVAWTDDQGTDHGSGRPACLPPTGRGLEGPVTLGVLPDLEVAGRTYDQVVWVGC